MQHCNTATLQQSEATKTWQSQGKSLPLQAFYRSYIYNKVYEACEDNESARVQQVGV